MTSGSLDLAWGRVPLAGRRGSNPAEAPRIGYFGHSRPGPDNAGRTRDLIWPFQLYSWGPNDSLTAYELGFSLAEILAG
jgi:hypothetical protein